MLSGANQSAFRFVLKEQSQNISNQLELCMASFFPHFQSTIIIQQHSPSLQLDPAAAISNIQILHKSPPLPRRHRVRPLILQEIVSRFQISLQLVTHSLALHTNFTHFTKVQIKRAQQRTFQTMSYSLSLDCNWKNYFDTTPMRMKLT